MTDHTEPTNRNRAAWADIALGAFRDTTGADREDALSDLLCDLMHWSGRHGFNFEAELSRAQGHFEEENQEEEMAAYIAAAPYLAEALIDIKRLAGKHDDSGRDPHALLELIECKAAGALAAAKEAGQ